MVAKKGTRAGRKSKGSKTAAKESPMTAAGRKKDTSKGGGKEESVKNLAPTQDPIIITGGSVMLQYANTASDGFDDNGSGNGKKKLKHKKNGTGNVELTVIEIEDTTGVLQPRRIDLRPISRHCKITIRYNF
jgi:hypothetical protein